MSCMNHGGGGGELRASGAAKQGICFRIGKPGKHFTDFAEVPRLFPLGNGSGIRCPLEMCSGRKTVMNARAIVINPSCLRHRACDISAERFVTTKQQSGGTNHNEEVVSVASCVHVPKLRLGETHVPERFSTKTRKNTSGCGEDPLWTLRVDRGH